MSRRAMNHFVKLVRTKSSGTRPHDRRWWLLAVCSLALASASFPAKAEDTPGAPRIESVRVGFGGHYKVGFWTPVQVTLTGPFEGSVELIVPDGDGELSRVKSPPQIIKSKTKTTVLLYAKMGRIYTISDENPCRCGAHTAPRGESSLTVRLLAKDNVVARKIFRSSTDGQFPPALQAHEELVLAIGPPLFSNSGQTESPTGHLGSLHLVQLDDFSQLPTKWYGYEGVDALILTTSRWDRDDGPLPSTEQIDALDRWVRLGGKLVLSAGKNAKRILAKDQPLSQFAPGKVSQVVELFQSHTAPLEMYAGNSADLLVIKDPGGSKPSWSVSRFNKFEGLGEAFSEGKPLVIRSPHALGQVVFVAFDLDSSGFPEWTSQAALVNKILDRPTSLLEKQGKENNAQVLHVGYDDLSGQLRGALDQFATVTMVPFWQVATLIIGYIFFIGPIDYYFVRKVLKRPEWTWITFSSVVILFCAAAYVLVHGIKGNDSLLNQVDLVDVDTQSQLVRGTTWINVFSPGDRYNLKLATHVADKQLEDQQVILSWMGLPGSHLGGMNPSTADMTSSTGQYEFSRDLSTMTSVPMKPWSSKSLTARWSGKADLGIQSNLSSTSDNWFTGGSTITNNSTLQLKDCHLFHDHRVYTVGTFSPGQNIAIGDLTPISASTLLNRKRIVQNTKGHGGYEAVEPYDKKSHNISDILYVMMFHKEAGGTSYTRGLTNRYQHFVDLTDHLTTGRAILVGRAEKPASQLMRFTEKSAIGQAIEGTADQHHTYYRFVFPIKSNSGR